MTKTTSKKWAACKIVALLPVFIAAIFVFSTKTIAQNDQVAPQTNEIVENQVNKATTPALPQDGKTAELLKDSIFAARYKAYNQIIERYWVEKDGKKFFSFGSVTKEDMNKLNELFKAMTPEQKSVLSLVPQRRKAPAERIPTKEQLESWKVPTEYGVWLDGKRIENSELNRYQPSDFSLYYVSRLARNAKNYGKHVYQLDLYTTASYQEWKKNWDADETYYLMPLMRTTQ